MLVRFNSAVSLDDIGRLTERCEKLGVRFKFIQEAVSSYLVIESAEVSKIDELYHQLRHLPYVDSLIRGDRADNPLSRLKPVQFMAGNRRIGHGARPVVVAGSPFLENRKQAVSLATRLASYGANIFKAGPYRPTETLAAKPLYERTGSIVKEIEKRSGIPSTGMVEMHGPRTALSALEASILQLPGAFMFEAVIRDQLAKIGLPVFLERHPDASTSLWLEAAGTIVENGNPDVALVETGRRVGEGREIDLVKLAKLIDTCPLPVLVYASRVSDSTDEVNRISRAAIACGAAGVLIDVHPDPPAGLLTEGYCMTVEEFEETGKTLQSLMAQ